MKDSKHCRHTFFGQTSFIRPKIQFHQSAFYLDFFQSVNQSVSCIGIIAVGFSSLSLSLVSARLNMQMAGRENEMAPAAREPSGSGDDSREPRIVRQVPHLKDR